MKKTIDILKSENLKPKELALLLLTDIHENHKTGKEILAEKDKSVLMKRIKNFESREDCYEYNKYGRAYFEGAYVNVDVFTCDRETIRIIECLRWLLVSYVTNRISLNLVDDKQIKDGAQSLKKSIAKHICSYIEELKEVYKGLLAYKKIVDKSAEYVGLDINYIVNNAIKRVTEAVKTHNENIEGLHIKDDFHIDLTGITFNEKLHDQMVKFLGTIEHFETA